MSSRIMVVDTETTGLDPSQCGIVEIASVPVYSDNGSWVVGRGTDTLVDPGIPIPPESSGVHHLVTADVAGAPDLASGIEICGLDTAELIVAHNAAFDRGFLASLQHLPFICTFRCALHLWPDAPGHGNQTLRYWRQLGLSHHLSEMSSSRSLLPHSALFDAYTTAQLLVDMLSTTTVDELIRLSTAPVVLTKARFGKHAGKTWEWIVRADRSWCDWYLRLEDGDADVQHTIRALRERPPQGRLL